MRHRNRPGIAAPVALLAALFPLAACDSEPCEDTILEEVAAPGEPYVAAVMKRQCDDDAVGTVEGAERALVMAVLMRHAEEDSYGENALADALFIVDGDWRISISWIRPGWFQIDADNPPDRLLKWSANYEGGIVLYE
jgi:hypothetical protein